MIHLLSHEVASRIVAGEVIERPSSVVKELMENSIDAGARSIHLEIVGGGLTLIRVADDGSGIPAAEVELAFQRHATSKIRSVEDLERIVTMGYRGEALASLVAVASVTCHTRATSEAEGVQVRFVGGRLVERRILARPVGTTVAVEDLFAHDEHRRRFLKAPTAEASHAIAVATHLALAYPEIRVTVVNEGATAFQTPGRGDLQEALLSVYGVRLVRDMVAVGPHETRSTAGHLLCRVSGYAGRQWVHRANRAGLTFFVNRRWVRSPLLTRAVEDAYRGLTPTGRYPVVVLDIRVPPQEQSVLAHPAKSEVKFAREGVVYQTVVRALRERLEAEQALVPSWSSPPVADPPRSVPLPESAVPRADHVALRPSPVDGGPPATVTFGGDRLRVLGQVGLTYIIAEGAAGLYLVDQHAAHERVLLEQLEAGLATGETVQVLLEPVPVRLPPTHAADVMARLEDLLALGFVVEPFGPQTLLVRAVPTALAGRNPLAALQSSLEALASDARASDWRHRLATTLACRAAVKAGDPLTIEEMRALLARLDEATLCRVCAHGRPTAILLSHSQLEREFGRR